MTEKKFIVTKSQLQRLVPKGDFDPKAFNKKNIRLSNWASCNYDTNEIYKDVSMGAGDKLQPEQVKQLDVYLKTLKKKIVGEIPNFGYKEVTPLKGAKGITELVGFQKYLLVNDLNFMDYFM